VIVTNNQHHHRYHIVALVFIQVEYIIFGMSTPDRLSTIQEERCKRADGGEPINTETRTAFDNNGGMCSNLTDFGTKLHGIESGDEVRIEVHEDGIWIEPGGNDE